MSSSIGIIGAGGWGIALAKLLGDKQHDVGLWCHSERNFRELSETRESSVYLAGISLPRSVEPSRDIREVSARRDLVICAVPSHLCFEVLIAAAPHVSPTAILLSATKGIQEGGLKTMGDVFAEIFGIGRRGRFAFLSGPTFATEVARGLPAAVTVAAYDETVAGEVQETLSTPNLRVYTSKDVVGVQMGGVIKNVIAIAAGISDGLGLGYNARAALITRGLAEMTRLAVRMGADPMTLAGLPGLGDLILTCTGDLSRNRSVGIQIAAGRTVEEIGRESRMIAEGIRNTRSVWSLARKLGCEMPIVEQMHQVLYENKKPAQAVRDLMQRSLKPEIS
jgi:glycerol-3-phosphate dehydrogenase (NAD(P)+)